MTILLLLLIALWFGISVPDQLRDTPVGHMTQDLKARIDEYRPAAGSGPGEAGA